MSSLSRLKSKLLGQKKHGAGESDSTPDSESFPSGIKILFDPPGRLVDVVFVHGLTGDRERTWTSPVTGTCWPRDLLPTFLPDARILTFGYDAYVTRKHGQVAQIDISHHANDLLNHLVNERLGFDSASKPIVFVAHSLGGVLCKEAVAISEASMDDHLRSIAEHTRGIAFVGTPHAGSWLATWAKTPATLLGVVKRTDVTLLALLKPGSEVLTRIHDHFLVTLRQRELNQNPIEVACFYETLPFLGKVQIVDQSSATIPGYNNISIHADHRDVARFPSNHHPGFKSIVGVLDRWTQREGVPNFGGDAEAFLETISFKEMGVRQAIVETGETGTCKWLLENSTYQAWKSSKELEASHGLLWIKGKPGSGKSTLMKYIASKSAQVEGVVRLVFFFNARGAEAERNAEGLFKTFLHQLMYESRPMRNRLLTSFRRKKAMVGSKNTITWSRAELRDLFFDALSFSQDNKVEIFVDALDECKESEVADIVAAFEKCAAGYAERLSPDLKICWSSRHYPHISIEHGFELTVEAMNSHDIGLYVHRRIRRSNVYEPLRTMGAEIVDKAQGVFLWGVLVVNKICKLADKGLPIDRIQKLIRDLPTELSTLYSEIISTLDPGLAEDTASLMYLVLYATRPLDTDELRLGIEFMRKEYPTSLEPFSSLSEQISYFRLFITELSGGLLEVVDSGVPTGRKRKQPPETLEAYLGVAQPSQMPHGPKGKTSKSVETHDGETRWIVQVIHETVRDFLMRDGVCQLPGHWSPLSLDPLTGHLRLYQFCCRILATDEMSCILSQQKCHELWGRGDPPRLVELGSLWLGTTIAKYVLENICHHLRSCGFQSVSQQKGRLWDTMPDHLREEVQPKSTQRMALRWHSIRDAIHYYDVGRANPYPLKDFLDINLDFEDDVESYVIPEAFRRSNLSSHLCIAYAHICLWTLGRRTQCTEPAVLHEAIVATAHHGDALELEPLLSRLSTQDGILNLGNEPVRMAADAGTLSNVSLLLSKGIPADPSQSDHYRSTPLFLAVEKGLTNIVSELLRYGADPSRDDFFNQTPLFTAAEMGYLEIVKILLQHGADARRRSRSGDGIPYDIALARGHTEIADLLRPLTHTSSLPTKAKKKGKNRKKN